MYSLRPKLAANAKAPFWIRPHVQAEQVPAAGAADVRTTVEMVRKAKVVVDIMSAMLMHHGYEAELCMF